MKRHVAGGFLVAGCMMLVAGGCAKEQVVKKDEAVAPATVAPASAPAKKEVVNEQPVQAPVKESAANEDVKPAAQQEQLQALLEKIYFDFDSYKLTEANRSILAKNAAALRKDSAAKVRIEGNCDERGSDEYNLALGQKRAEAAKQYLVTIGVAADRISVISYGKEKPADPGHEEAAWARNRRDEFVVQ